MIVKGALISELSKHGIISLGSDEIQFYLVLVRRGSGKGGLSGGRPEPVTAPTQRAGHHLTLRPLRSCVLGSEDGRGVKTAGMGEVKVVGDTWDPGGWGW